jgi:nicotinate dehydrogenase subunit B
MSIAVDSRTPEISEPCAQGPYRAPGPAAGTFARESHIDDLAYRAGADPVDFRLGLLDDERLAAVIEAAARRFGWRFPWCPAGGPAMWAKGWLRRGTGVAVGLEAGRRVATCAEVRPDGAGQLRVTRIVTAYECGAVADRDAVIGQIKSETVMALSSYLVPSLAGGPELDVMLLDRPDLLSAGVGETPLLALAPAIANAIFVATGRRLRSLPLIPEARAAVRS